MNITEATRKQAAIHAQRARAAADDVAELLKWIDLGEDGREEARSFPWLAAHVAKMDAMLSAIIAVQEVEAPMVLPPAYGARMGIACTSPEGEDLGWTPVAIVDGEEGKELRFQDGNYGMMEWLMEQCPYARTDADEDEASRWVDHRLSMIEEDMWRGVVSGAKEGVCPTDSPIRWKLVTADEYDGKI